MIYICHELFQTEVFNDDNKVGSREKCFKTLARLFQALRTMMFSVTFCNWTETNTETEESGSPVKNCIWKEAKFPSQKNRRVDECDNT